MRPAPAHARATTGSRGECLALVSNPRARSANAKALWRRLRAVPSVEIVRRRKPAYEYAFMLAASLQGGRRRR
jgi:hypothetical protein